MIRIDVSPRGRVDASVTIDVPLSATTVWGQMRDIATFITIDPLHHRLRLEPDGMRTFPPPIGTRFVLEHRVLGIGPDRVGRILRWREGEGYAVSDLSRRGPGSGFPHVCVYRVEPVGPHASQVVVEARGRWTARWMPRWLTRAWLRWVLVHTGEHIETWFSRFDAARANAA